MRAGASIGYWGAGPPRQVEQRINEWEACGIESIWTAEAYGSDALTPLGWWGARTTNLRLGTAICQLSARTPTALAMAAQTLDHLSGGRFVLGIGASGPQVVEGWYGQPYPSPLERTREYVSIMRSVWKRESPVTFSGRHYNLPYSGGTGLGKPLRSTVHALRPDIPILLGAEGPKNVALAAEIADGWLPLWFSPNSDAFYRAVLAEGFARPDARRTSEDFEVAAVCWLVENDDVDVAAAALKPVIALYIGGMGASGANFHNDVFMRMGWTEVCQEVQALYLAGRVADGADAIPTALVDDVALIGPADRICEQITQRWRPTCVNNLIIGGWPRSDTRERILDAIRA